MGLPDERDSRDQREAGVEDARCAGHGQKWRTRAKKYGLNVKTLASGQSQGVLVKRVACGTTRVA